MQLFKFRVSSNQLKESSDIKEDVSEKEDSKNQLREKEVSKTEEEEPSYSDIDPLLEESRFDEAIDRIDELLKEKREDSMLWYKKGEAFKNLKQFKEAILCYNEAVEISPMFEDAWFEMGVLLFKIEELEKARECFAWILVVNPESSRAKKILSNLSRKMALLDNSTVTSGQNNGDRRKVRKVIKVRKKVTLKPKDKIEKDLELNNALHELDCCINQLEEEMITEVPENPDPGNNIDNFQNSEVDPKNELLPIFEQLSEFMDEFNAIEENNDLEFKEQDNVEDPPQTSDTSIQDLIDEARSHLEKKDFTEALNSINKALEKDTHQGDAWSTKGDVFMEMGQIDDATSCYKKAIVTSLKPIGNDHTGKELSDEELKDDFKDVFASLFGDEEE